MPFHFLANLLCDRSSVETYLVGLPVMFSTWLILQRIRIHVSVSLSHLNSIVKCQEKIHSKADLLVKRHKNCFDLKCGQSKMPCY